MHTVEKRSYFQSICRISAWNIEGIQFCLVLQHEASELAQAELAVGGGRCLRHHPPGHLADAESHEERRALRGGAETQSSQRRTGLSALTLDFYHAAHERGRTAGTRSTVGHWTLKSALFSCFKSTFRFDEDVDYWNSNIKASWDIEESVSSIDQNRF